ncbi:MAG: hypothetical protein WBM68_01585 [Woeseia sp.]
MSWRPVAAGGGRPVGTHVEQQLTALGTIVTVSASQTSRAEFATALVDLESYFLAVGKDWYPWAPGELAAVNTARY